MHQCDPIINRPRAVKGIRALCESPLSKAANQKSCGRQKKKIISDR